MVKRRGSRRRRHQRGSGYSFGQAVAPEAPYAQTVIGGTPGTPDCLASTRPGMASVLPGTGGLPGFSGGANIKSSASLANALDFSASIMKGGRYTADVGQGPITNSAGPGMGGYPIINRTGCEGGIVTAAPPGATANPTPFQQQQQNGGVGGIDSASYTAPTAGYGNAASTWVSSAGSPSLLQQPYDARIMNPACLTTAGGSRRRRKSRTPRKLSRKSRKVRKNRG